MSALLMRMGLAPALIAVLVVSACSSGEVTQVSTDPTGSGSAPAEGPLTSAAGGGPTDARTITYEVHYAELSRTGEAEVTYTVGDGTTVTKTVDLPWESEPIAVEKGRSYRIEATAPPSSGSHFYCGVHTDTRWNAGETSTGGETCVYTFPDDV